MIGPIVYGIARCVIRFLQALPLRWAARLGRAGGALAYVIDTRHRRVALRNLTMCFGREMDPRQIRAVARENFRRLGENYCSAIKTAAMTWEELQPHVEFAGPDWIRGGTPGQPPPSAVVAIGHFGNFELYARFGDFNSAYRCATTYRGQPSPALNRLLQSLREKSGCHYFERRTEMAALRAWMAPRGRLVGFLADQHAGRSGVRAPFFGVDCATTAAPVVLALRYSRPLYVSVCYRIALARWRIEFSSEIATQANGRARPIEEITAEINRAFESAIRRDPANWFWVHQRWKAGKLPARRRIRSTSVEAATADPGL